jgi:hypothetical protein
MKVSKQPDGATVTRWLDNRTVEITFEGQISPALVEQLIRDFASIAAARSPRYALFDASPATGFSANARANASRFLIEFKRAGGREIVAIVNLLSLRMLGQALTFATGIPLKMFPTREQALGYLVAKLRED